VAIYRVLRTNGSFEPEAIRAMHSAYEAVCEHLGLHNQKNDRVTEIVALKIIEAAKAGERDPTVLRDRAIKALGIDQAD
jgi:hypothetical protein